MRSTANGALLLPSSRITGRDTQGYLTYLTHTCTSFFSVPRLQNTFIAFSNYSYTFKAPPLRNSTLQTNSNSSNFRLCCLSLVAYVHTLLQLRFEHTFSSYFRGDGDSFYFFQCSCKKKKVFFLLKVRSEVIKLLGIRKQINIVTISALSNATGSLM